jgi:hypothetical protein
LWWLRALWQRDRSSLKGFNVHIFTAHTKKEESISVWLKFLRILLNRQANSVANILQYGQWMPSNSLWRYMLVQMPLVSEVHT